MRIKRLSLEPYGQFKDLDLNLPPSGICFVYGLNGAGKTTVRQAILDLMFGMPVKIQANWNFSWKFGSAVQVRAILDGLGDGNDFEVVRRKEKEDSLRGADGSHLTEDLFSAVIGGRSQELFAGFFSISHEEIRQFGHELAQGKADREALVFGPGLGGSPQILRALADLKEESERLYLSTSGTNQAIPTTIGELREKLEDAREQRVPPLEWTRKEGERTRLEKEEVKLEEEKGELESNLRSKRRYLSVLSDIRKLETLREETPFDQSMVDLEEAIRQKVEEHHQQVSLVENHLHERDSKMKAREDVDTESILQSLGISIAGTGQSPDIDSAITMSAPELVATYLSDGLANPAIDPDLRTAIQKLQDRIANLSFFEQEGIEAFRKLRSKLPERSVIEDFRRRAEDLEEEKEAQREKIRRAREQRTDKRGDLKVLEKSTPVPTRDEITEERAFRDSVWQAIRSAWLEGNDEPGREISNQENGKELPVVFESSLKEADEMADKRADEAEAANRKETLKAEIEELGDQERNLVEDMTQLESESEGLLASFRELWEAVDGIEGLDEPLLTQTMVDWLETVNEIEQEVEAMYEMVIQLQRDLQRESEAVEKLGKEIERLSQPIETFTENVIKDVAGKLGDTVDPNDPSQVVSYLQDLHRRIKARLAAEKEKDQLKNKIIEKGQEKLEILENATKGMNPDQLEADIASLERDLETLADERRDLRTEIEGIITWQATASAGKSVRQSEYEARVLEETLQEEINEFVRLRMAATILEQAQKSYTSKASGPVLERALEILSAMTGGLFVDFDLKKKSSKEQLVVKRIDGQDVEVKYLSDGEKDALAFALRVATLEYLIKDLEIAERPPVVFDDALVNLDDEMARIGIGCLTPLSEMTQVLFFTHHLHMLELAEEELEPSAWEKREVKQSVVEGLPA